MRQLHRISVLGLFVGWVMLAFAGKTFRGDEDGTWMLVNPILALGTGILLVSSIGAFVAIVLRPANRGQP